MERTETAGTMLARLGPVKESFSDVSHGSQIPDQQPQLASPTCPNRRDLN